MIDGGASGRRLSASDRAELRRLIDAEVRKRIAWADDCRCSGCGVELVDSTTGEERYVPGCRTCTDRRIKRRTRPRVDASRRTDARPNQSMRSASPGERA